MCCFPLLQAPVSNSHDIQSDMGREGSGGGGGGGGGGHMSDDDEEYSSIHASGDGSGDGKLPYQTVFSFCHQMCYEWK